MFHRAAMLLGLKSQQHAQAGAMDAAAVVRSWALASVSWSVKWESET